MPDGLWIVVVFVVFVSVVVFFVSPSGPKPRVGYECDSGIGRQLLPHWATVDSG